MAEPALLRALLPLWQRILDVGEIGPDDDFFALGGHSIAAAQLFALIQRELGCSAPLAALYDASTPRMLANVLSRGSKIEDWRSLVAINRSGDRPPLFLVHAAEGNVLLYRSLAAHLGADQPVFGLQSAGLDGRSPVDGRFEHVARRYVDEIRQVQPHGPYMLGGYCLGGTLALEMARQLIESGETVRLVALIEVYNIRALCWPLPLHQRLINRFVLNPYFHLQNLMAAEGVGKHAFFMEKLRVEITRIKASARFGWARLLHRLLPDAAAATPQAKLADIYEEAFAQYDVRPYPGELTVFLAERHLAGFHAHLGGWGEVAQGGVRFFSLPISPRGSLVEPHVGQLAVLLRGCLDRAIEDSKIAVHEPSLEVVSCHLSCSPQNAAENF
jgi:thioesterase domain-containing protein/acyl carrier protein